MEEGAVWAAEATGVETVRQALVCLRGTADKISNVEMASRDYSEEGGGLCLYVCVCMCVSAGFVNRGSLCVCVKLSVLIRISEPGCCLYHQELFCQETHLYDTYTLHYLPPYENLDE